MWHDNWHHLGPLQPLFGDRTIYDAASNSKAKVSEFIDGFNWKWPASTTWELNDIKNSPLPSINPMTSDSVKWTPNRSGNFSIASAYESTYSRGNEVQWHGLVWNKMSIPKCSFILWLACRKALVTKDKLFDWGVVDNKACLLCNSGIETIKHILMECPFSKIVWDEILFRNQSYRAMGRWDIEIRKAVADSKGIDLKSRIKTTSFSATIYCLWQERNSRLHNKGLATTSKVIRSIEEMVRGKSSYWKKYRRSYSNWMTCNLWGLPNSLLYD